MAMERVVWVGRGWEVKCRPGDEELRMATFYRFRLPAFELWRLGKA